MFNAAALSAALVPELEHEPRSLDALCAKFSVSKEKIKIALAGLEADHKVHRGQAGPQSPVLWHAGPRPPASAPDVDPNREAEERIAASLSDGSVYSPFQVRFTTLEDLLEHGRVQNEVGGMGLPDGTEEGTRALMGLALKQTIITMPDGTTAIAKPKRDGVVGREYEIVAASRLEATARRDLKFMPAGIWSQRIPNSNPSKAPRRKELQQILNELSVPATALVYDGVAPYSHIDADGIFHMRCWVPLPIEAKFDADCDAYLRTWGEQNFVRMCDWFAHVPNVAQPAPMIVFQGGSGDGKDMIAAALAGLYRRRGGPVTGNLAVDAFNADLASVPIVCCSERVPTDFRGAPISTAVFRELVSRLVHDVNEKNQRRVKLLGHVRWVLTTNELNFYPSRERLSRESIDAIANRILFIESPTLPDGSKAPKAFLQKHGGFALTKDWIDGEARLVRHLRYIVDTHKIVHPCPEGRMGVAADAGSFRDRLAFSTQLASLIIDGLVRFVVGEPSRRALGRSVRVGDGRVLVQISELLKQWQHLVAPGSTEDRLDARRTTPLANAFADEVRERLSREDVPLDGKLYRSIRVELLLSHAHTIGLDSVELGEKLALPEAEFNAWQAARFEMDRKVVFDKSAKEAR